MCQPPKQVGDETIFSFDSTKDVVIPKGYHCTLWYNRTKDQLFDENKLVFEFTNHTQHNELVFIEKSGTKINDIRET